MFTCDDTKFLYQMVKESSEKKNISAVDFQRKFLPIWRDLTSSPFPDFGACDECVQKIKLKEVKKHKKTLKKSESKQWNLFEHFQ